MGDHAILAPSSASRWLACTPSARLEEGKQTSSVYAEEGTLAHRYGELIIKSLFGMITDKHFNINEKEIQGNHLYTEEMYDYCYDYARYVAERFNETGILCPDARLDLEKKLDLTKYIPFSFGTCDVCIVSDGKLIIIDLKYGKGVAVDSYENKQMMVYALGVLDDYDFAYEIDMVEMVIYQPRLGAISNFIMSTKELKAWGDAELRPKASLAWQGAGSFMPGEHCKFCKVKAECGALAEHNLALARHEFKEPSLLTDEELVNIFKQASMFENWLTAVKDHMSDQAINNEKHWPGLKLVAGKSSRKYIDESKVATKLLSAGFEQDDIYKKTLLGITAMTKVLGKKDFDTHLTDLLIKPPGSPCLVTENDPRAEINSLLDAQNDFLE